jgi:hypothetical protein
VIVGLITSRQEEVFQCTKLSCGSASVGKSAVNDWYQALKEILKKYAQRDVYNADESALYYIIIMLSDKTHVVKDDPRKGGKQSKECLTPPVR